MIFTGKVGEQMKNIKFYNQKIKCSNSEVFDYIIGNLKETIKGWDYFVDWAKIFGNVDKIEVSLNIMNYLIGKSNIEEEFKKLLKEYPEIVTLIPILVACRDGELTVLDPSPDDVFNYKNYSFKKKKTLSEREIDTIAEFALKSGILEIFRTQKIKNVVDYVTGIEVGLDTNARKNRSGTSMELITDIYIKKICEQNKYKYISQATPKKIREEFGYEVKVDKAKRIFDFAVTNNSSLYLIETNYYGGGGSKLKATAGEYKALFDFIKAGNDNHKFIWITDGKGWISTKNSLKETFEHIDYLLNLDMLEKGLLADIIVNDL